MNYDCVISLVSAGSDVNKPDARGCTALHYAAATDADARLVDVGTTHCQKKRCQGRKLRPRSRQCDWKFVFGGQTSYF